MKILIIVHTFFPYSSGGTEMYVKSIALELSKKHKIVIFHKYDPNNISSLSDDILNQSNIKCIALPKQVPEAFEMTYYDKSSIEELRNILKEFSPDVVHINHLLFHSFYYLEQLIEANIPVVVTLHDYWYICPQCFLTHTDGTLCEGPGISGKKCITCDNAEPTLYIPLANAISSEKKKVAFLNKIKSILPDPIRKSIRFLFLKAKTLNKKEEERYPIIRERLNKAVTLLNRTDFLIAPSPVLAEKYREAGVKNIEIIPHGIETPLEPFTIEKKYGDIAKRKIIFGYLGGFLQHKGIEVIIEAFNNISKSDAELWIFGTQGIDIKYERKVLKKIHSSSIKIMGFIEHSKIFEVFKNIDVLVVPSICTENFPLVIMEAFAAKIPVIGSNVGGIKAIVKDKINGFLFDKGDIKKLSDIIKKIIRNREIILELSKNIPPIKSIEEHAKELEQIYEKVISLKKRDSILA